MWVQSECRDRENNIFTSWKHASYLVWGSHTLGLFGNTVYIPVDCPCLCVSSFRGNTAKWKRGMCKQMRGKNKDRVPSVEDWSTVEVAVLSCSTPWMMALHSYTLYSVSGNVEYQFTQQTSMCLSFSFGKGFCCWSSVPPFNLKLLSFVSPPLFQTPKDPASREILRCHGHQADPANTAADLYIYNAFQCLRLIQARTHMCTHKHTHSLPISHIHCKHVWLWHRDLSQCDDPFSVSDYIHWSELYQVCRLAFVQARRK